ncbi:hypothetical protein ATE92_0896 [Ulvibacter sp. MAR_2010_11]|uniref:hypothetical protein n=1 Tax=Ulvibacter sp. MAR_2010_11 TaxID=1250229 RepID=UPI000C2C7959|nr:hypothetical protein [Ulvibacter sp. MAR_2010_11]PKA82759.1 hypothetical protein ATE92_0896 [Ulvibacter sp. MAR_2010_11]
MKKYFVLFAFLLIFSKPFCQLPERSSGQVVTGSNMSIFNDPNFTMPSNSAGPAVLKYQEIEGTPYIDNSSETNAVPIGKFYSPDFEYIETALARYNAYTDNMEVSLLEDGIDYYYLRKKPDYLYIVLGKKTYRAYNVDGSYKFFVILSENDTQKCTLLKKETIEFMKAEKASSSFVTDTPNSFKRVRDVYYFKMGHRLLEIPKNKKSFYGLFNEKKNAVRSYIETNRLKINDEEDLIKISNYYNTLL